MFWLVLKPSIIITPYEKKDPLSTRMQCARFFVLFWSIISAKTEVSYHETWVQSHSVSWSTGSLLNDDALMNTIHIGD